MIKTKNGAHTLDSRVYSSGADTLSLTRVPFNSTHICTLLLLFCGLPVPCGVVFPCPIRIRASLIIIKKYNILF
jgi:hypothetical protein